MYSRAFFVFFAAFFTTAVLQLAATGVQVNFIGGTVPSLTGLMRLDVTGAETLEIACKKARVSIPYRRVNTVEYGQKVGRRYISAVLISPLLLLSKSRKHYITLGYTDENGRQQALVFRVGKGDIRGMLAGLEARTGRKVEYQDDEARKSGKG